jgi:hypothetical protein
VVEGEDAVGLLGLLDDGFDVANLGDRFKNLLLLGLVGAALLLGLLHHLVVLPHQSPPQPRLLVLPHLKSLSNRCFPAFSSLSAGNPGNTSLPKEPTLSSPVDDDEYGGLKCDGGGEGSELLKVTYCGFL